MTKFQDLDIIKIIILTKLNEFWIDFVPSRVYRSFFFIIRSSDLVFDPICTSFQSDLDFDRE